MNYYNKYLKYKNKYLNFIMRGGGIKLSFTNSKKINVPFEHKTDIIIQNELYFVNITYSNNKKYGYYYLFDENNDGVIFLSTNFSNWFEIKGPQSITNIITNIMPKYSDNNIFNIEDNNYIFYYYYYYNNSRNVNILDITKISEKDKNKIIEGFINLNNNFYISFDIDINYNEKIKRSYNIYFKFTNNKTYGFIQNKLNNKLNYLVCNKIVNVKSAKIESESKTNLNFNSQNKKFVDLEIEKTFTYETGKKSIWINEKNNNWLHGLNEYLKKEQKNINTRKFHIELSTDSSLVKQIYINIGKYKITKRYLLDRKNWVLMGLNAYVLMLDNLLNNTEKKKHITFLYNKTGISSDDIEKLHTNIIEFFK